MWSALSPRRLALRTYYGGECGLDLNGSRRRVARSNEHFMFPWAELRVETPSQQFAQHEDFRLRSLLKRGTFASS
jgi:hypothetical protein